MFKQTHMTVVQKCVKGDWGSRTELTLLTTLGNGVLECSGPRPAVVNGPTDQLVHLRRLLALTDEINAAAVSCVRLLADDQFRQRYHARLHTDTVTVTSQFRVSSSHHLVPRPTPSDSWWCVCLRPTLVCYTAAILLPLQNVE